MNKILAFVLQACIIRGMKNTVLVRLSDEDFEKLNKLKDILGLTTSKVLREALKRMFKINKVQ